MKCPFVRREGSTSKCDLVNCNNKKETRGSCSDFVLRFHFANLGLKVQLISFLVEGFYLIDFSRFCSLEFLGNFIFFSRENYLDVVLRSLDTGR